MYKGQSGQAMVEAMAVVLIICAFVFGLMQLALIGTTYMSGYDAVQAAIRSRIVNGNGENSEIISRWVGRVVLLSTQFRKLVLFGPGGIYPRVDFSYKDVINGKKDYADKPIKIVTTKLIYLEKLIFAFLFRPVNSSPGGTIFYNGFHTASLPPFMKPRITFSRMVISPDENFYYKAYPGADND
ncbi:hypothetical protein KAI68_04855 [bacterium]|nr:hypothetical protein [bacterium]